MRPLFVRCWSDMTQFLACHPNASLRPLNAFRGSLAIRGVPFCRPWERTLAGFHGEFQVAVRGAGANEVGRGVTSTMRLDGSTLGYALNHIPE